MENILIETLFLLINLEEYSEDNLSKNIYPIVEKNSIHLHQM